MSALFATGTHRSIIRREVIRFTQGRLSGLALSEITATVSGITEDQMMRPDYLDVSRLKTASLSGWIRANVSRSIRTVMRNRGRRPEGHSVPLHTEIVIDPGTGIRDPLRIEGPEEVQGARLFDMALDHAMQQLAPSDVTRRSLTVFDRIHIAGEAFAILEGFPMPPMIVSYADRQEVRAVLESDPQAAVRSLISDDSDIPTALTELWCKVSAVDRETLAESPVAAHHIALDRVSPYSCARKDVLRRFVSSAVHLSPSPVWQKSFRRVAKAFAAAFLDLGGTEPGVVLPPPEAWDHVLENKGYASLHESPEKSASILLAHWVTVKAARQASSNPTRGVSKGRK